MRITRDALLKFARTTVDQRTRYNRHVMCVYLTGSLLDEEPLLGGAADIDLVFIHDIDPAQPREIQPLTDTIHLDIAHLSQSLFLQPRSLRSSAWLGSYLVQGPMLLHENQHWFEFTQAAVFAGFNTPEYRLRRARPLAEEARQAWFNLRTAAQPGPAAVHAYLHALEQAANAVACLSGPPLTERRFMLQFPERAAAIDKPGLSQGLVDLYSRETLDPDVLAGWLDAWGVDFTAAGETESAPARLHPARKRYYRGAIESLSSDQPEASLWLLLRTWTLSACTLAQPSQGWQALAQALQLGPDDLSQRLEALDAYLDVVEETLDQWGEQNGVSSPPFKPLSFLTHHTAPGPSCRGCF